ncbi:MAG: WYL domain-containing protein, partial [Rhodospirillales bacterium]|nr:WYL domain-containing protein [Rhodospirillales bacterium]
VRIGYADAAGRTTERTIWPLAMAYFVDVNVIGAWCELRADLRNFRVDRITRSAVLAESYPAEIGPLLERWFAEQAEAASVREEAGEGG